MDEGCGQFHSLNARAGLLSADAARLAANLAGCETRRGLVRLLEPVDGAIAFADTKASEPLAGTDGEIDAAPRDRDRGEATAGETRACCPAVRRTALFASLTIAATLTIVACGNPTPPPAPSATRTEDAASTESTATPGRVAVSPGPGPGATPPTPSGADALAAASCAKDTDCAWDDPCVPRRCIAAAASPPAVGCDKSVPPEGTCVCFDRRCVYRPNATRSPVSVDAACTSPPGCVMDVAGGTCVPGDDPEAHPPGLPGPRCRCDSHEPRRCHYDWVEPVPCASDDDCWVSDEGSQPIARPTKLRGKRFRPCKDGERAPVCQSGTCAVRAYRC